MKKRQQVALRKIITVNGMNFQIEFKKIVLRTFK